MNHSARRFKLLIMALFGLLAVLACGVGGVNLPERDQIDSGLATAQAAAEQVGDLAEQAGPTLEALATSGSEFATNARPTLEALATSASIYATEAAPTVDVALEVLATTVVEARERGELAQATLVAAGIDGEYLKNKLLTLKPDENGNVNLVITEVEMNLVLQARVLGSDATEAAEASVPEVRFTNGQMIVTRNVSVPVSGQMQLVLAPIAVPGAEQLSFDIISASLGDTSVPPALLDSTNATINATINEALLAVPGPFTVKAVFVNEGSMLVVMGR